MGALWEGTLEEAFEEGEVRTGLGKLFSLGKAKEDVTGMTFASWLACLKS